MLHTAVCTDGRPEVEQVKGEITELLVRFRERDPQAEAQLIPLIYDELRRQAHRCLNRERGDHTLQPTALVHEVFLRMASETQPPWQSRAHFFGVAARLMRQILVDHARRHQSLKRGGSCGRSSLEEELVVYSVERSAELLALDDALCRLAEQDERQSRIVEMKFFAGLDIEEIAKVLEISPRTVKRDWTMARAWLHQEMAR
ncbi:MAG: sigma-70 family RNA polymerase sigma factor [Terriglobales bacterium]